MYPGLTIKLNNNELETFGSILKMADSSLILSKVGAVGKIWAYAQKDIIGDLRLKIMKKGLHGKRTYSITLKPMEINCVRDCLLHMPNVFSSISYENYVLLKIEDAINRFEINLK